MKSVSVVSQKAAKVVGRASCMPQGKGCMIMFDSIMLFDEEGACVCPNAKSTLIIVVMEDALCWLL